MSHVLTREEILFRQRFLSCCGVYSDALDGLWGRRTDAAEASFADQCQTIAKQEGRFDPRSEKNILSLRCDAQAAARRSLNAIGKAGFEARIISGTRTYPEQAALYRQGRFGNPGPVVTKARAGQSWHNFGLAWDIGIFEDGAYVANDVTPYKACAAPGKVAGVEWGGDWTSFKDYPHYQFATQDLSVAKARASFEQGGRA